MDYPHKAGNDTSPKIKVSEIFGPTIQGEGAVIGRPTVFVRTGGCDYRCDWCDTLHAVDSEYRHTWKPMSATDIFAQIKILSNNHPILVSLSGGNPAIQPLGDLITLGKKHDYSFMMETQGSIAQDWFKDLDILTLSPKPPSSKMPTDFTKLNDCIAAAGQGAQVSLKIVIFDDLDYAYAKDIAARYPTLPLYIQPGNPNTNEAAIDQNDLNARMLWLIEKATNDNWYKPTILPQLHVTLWGNKKGV
jgi:7-carboxy-7-deazaguanine synthase